MQMIDKPENQETATSGMQSVQMDENGGDISHEKTSCNQYRGKYPNRIMMIYSDKGEMKIKTNGGAIFKYQVLHRSAPLPLVGQDIEDWLLHVSPLNDKAYDVEIKAGF